MKENPVYDVAGIGIGPFNLGFAALTAHIPALQCIFFDKAPGFDWHPGMMLDFATLQVPFLADLVTTADPCNRYSFVSYLKQNNRLYQFAIKEDNYISRREYNLYCKWVASQLSSLYFGMQVTEINYDEKTKLYALTAVNMWNGKKTIFHSRKLLLGTGTMPSVPTCLQGFEHPLFLHSSQYLQHKKDLLKQDSISVIGSGQSAAEIFYDLLQQTDLFPGRINWFSRAKRFFPMDVSKLSFEMTSPDYIDYFYYLSASQKKKTSMDQHALYKGINQELIAAIYKLLYEKSLYCDNLPVCIAPNCELREIKASNDTSLSLLFHHLEEDRPVHHTTNAVIAATGYVQRLPEFIKNIHGRIDWNDDGLYAVKRHYAIDINGTEIFVQNAELHTHGFSAPDLGMGAYRNAVIINCLLGYEYFLVEKKIAFQSFGTSNSYPQ